MFRCRVRIGSGSTEAKNVTQKRKKFKNFMLEELFVGLETSPRVLTSFAGVEEDSHNGFEKKTSHVNL